MKIGEKIQTLRQERHWTQKELADKLNIYPHHISRYERDFCNPSAESLAKIAEVFGVSSDYFLNDELEDAADFKLSDKELQRYFKEADKLNEEDKQVIKRVIESILAKNTNK